MTTTTKIRRTSTASRNNNVRVKRNKNIEIKAINAAGFKKALSFLFGSKDKAKNTIIAILTFGLIITTNLYKDTKADINDLVTKFNQAEYSVKSTENNGVQADNNSFIVPEKEEHNISVPTDCNTDSVGKEENLKDKTIKIIHNMGFKVADGVGGADHQLINDNATKDKIMDAIKTELGRTDVNMFNPLDVKQISGLSENDFRQILPDGLKEVASVFYNAEHSDRPINGLFLASICRLESADGTSKLAKERNNIAGLNARDKDKGTDAYGSKFNSKTDSANELVRKIRDEYIYSDSDFRANGHSIYDVNKRYCSMCTWSYKVIDRAKDLESRYNK